MIVNDSMMNMDSSFYTVNEVAELLRVSKLTIWRYINAGKLPAYKLGRDWRIKKSELESFIESRRNNGKKAST